MGISVQILAIKLILTRLQLIRVAVNISRPWLVNEFVPKNIPIAHKFLCHSLPEEPKSILYALLIIIQALPVDTKTILLRLCIGHYQIAVCFTMLSLLHQRSSK